MPRNDRRGIHRMKTIAVLLGVTVVLMAGLAFVRTLRNQPSAPAVVPAPAVMITAAAVERLAGSIRIPTISHEDPAAFDGAAFRALHDHLEAGFPRVHARLQRETVATHSLLYAWRGSDPSLQPILLAAHLDVVPIEDGTQPQWEEAPFSGRVADGFVWGRGSIDNKSAVVGTLEAVEMLLSEGFQPARTIYLAYGSWKPLRLAPRFR
jgi:carboxypeptidase PM20D1